MNAFEQAALRLKQQLGMTTDKEVAEVLGMSARAWVGRKNRGSFPETELYALIAKRPDLQIDALYVLRGQRKGELLTKASGMGARIREYRLAASIDQAAFAASLGVPVDQLVQIEDHGAIPGIALQKRLLALAPDMDPMWLLLGEKQRIEGDLTAKEVVLVANYRASSAEGRLAIEQLALHFAGRARAQAAADDQAADSPPGPA